MNSDSQVCPSCGAAFTPFVRNGVMVPICGSCEQNFIARGLLPALSAEGEQATSAQRLSESAQEERPAIPAAQLPAAPLATAQSPFSPSFQAGSPGTPAPATGQQMDPRFAPLSSLPPDKRLPPKRQGAALGAQTAQLSAPAMPPASPTASTTSEVVKSLPLPEHAIPTDPKPRHLPGVAAVRPLKVQEKKIGFNCPACLAVLIIKQPDNYDGSAAPCPNCGTHILPPRIANVSPFKLLQSTNPAVSPGRAPIRRDLPVLPAVPISKTQPAIEGQATELPSIRRGLANAAML